MLTKSQQDTALKYYKVLAVTSLSYGIECWTVTKNSVKKLDLQK